MSTNYSDSDISDSILLTVKKLLGLDPDYTPFDVDILMHINTAISNLHQMGVGPAQGMMITDASTKWDELLGPLDLNMLQSVKSYVYIYVRKIFDPPGATNHLTALESVQAELEWRISVRREEAIYDSRYSEIPYGGPYAPYGEGMSNESDERKERWGD